MASDYKVVWVSGGHRDRGATIREMESAVRAALSAGWKPQGGVSAIVIGQSEMLVQAMVKE